MKRLIYICLGLVLLIGLIIPVSAMNESGELISSVTESNTGAGYGGAFGSYNVAGTYIRLKNIENYDYLILYTGHLNNTAALVRGGGYITAHLDSSTGPTLGTAYISIFENGVDLTVHVQFYSWNRGAYTGDHVVYFTGFDATSSSVPAWLGPTTVTNHCWGVIDFPTGGQITPYNQGFTAYYTSSYSANYTFTDSGAYGRLSVNRTATTYPKPAYVIIKNSGGTTVTSEYKPSGTTENLYIPGSPIFLDVGFGAVGGNKTKTFTLSGASGSAPIADFTGTPLTGVPPLDVYFTDTSTGSPTGWYWNFGDGWTSYQQNPIHTYSSPGTYTVSLEASNVAGSDTETKTDHITAGITGSYNLKINPVGKNLTHLSGVNVSVYTDPSYSTLYNSQITDAITYRYNSDLPANQQYYVTLVKSGFINATSSVFLNINRDYDVMMYLPGETIPDTTNYTSMSVFVFSTTTGLSVPALVSYYTDSGRTSLFGSAYVNQYSGSANIYLEQEQTYYGRITASGYYPYDFTVSTGTSASIERTYRISPIAAPATSPPGTTGTPGATPTYMTIATLSAAERSYQVDVGLDIWYRNLGFLSSLFFLAVVTGTLSLMQYRRGRRP